MAKATHEILVVDDDPNSRVFVRRVLESSGYKVGEAQSMIDGLRSILERSPHLVVLDLVMPKINGLYFLEKRRNHPHLMSIPVLVLSGVTDKKVVYRANALGASDYATKPISAPQLVQKVKRLLRDRAFPMVRFGAGKEPELKCHAQTTLLATDGGSLLLELAAKLKEGTSIQLEADLARDLELESSVFHRSGKQAKFNPESGQYVNEVIMSGMDPSTVRKLRDLMRTWK